VAQKLTKYVVAFGRFVESPINVSVTKYPPKSDIALVTRK